MPFAEALALSRRWYAVGLAGGARQAGTNAHNAADRQGSPWAAASEGLGLRDRARQAAEAKNQGNPHKRL